MTGTMTMPPPIPIRPASNPAPAPETNPRQISHVTLIGRSDQVGLQRSTVTKAAQRRCHVGEWRIASSSEGEPGRDVKTIDTGYSGEFRGGRARRPAYRANLGEPLHPSGDHMRDLMR